MAKNTNTNPTLDTATAGFTARFTELQSSFDGKGFFGKLLVSLLMMTALFALVLELAFLLLKSLFSLAFATMGDKTAVKMSKAVRKNNMKSFKQVANGKIAQEAVKGFSETIVSSIGGDLSVRMTKDFDAFYKVGQLGTYFKLLRIKDKEALLLIDSSSCQKLLNQYNKAHGSAMKLKAKVATEKLAKKANKKAAKKTRSVVLNVGSWSTTRNP